MQILNMLAILLNVYLLAKPLSNNGSLANETICSINVGPLPSKNVTPQNFKAEKKEIIIIEV